LAFETVRKLAGLLQDLKVPIIGVVENMKINGRSGIRPQTEKLGLTYLGEIPFDPTVEEAIGNPSALLNTVIARQIERIVSRDFEH